MARKRKFKLMLYREQDMDLLGLCLNDPKQFRQDVGDAIEAIMSGGQYTIEVPDKGFRNNYEGYLRRSLAVQIALSDNAWAQLAYVKPRLMTSFIKMAVRNCMTRLPYENYLRGDGIVCNRVTAELNSMFPDDEQENNTAQPVQAVKAPPKQKPIKKDKQNAKDSKPVTPARIKPPERTSLEDKLLEAELAREALLSGALPETSSKPKTTKKPPVQNPKPAAVKTLPAQPKVQPKKVETVVRDAQDDDDDFDLLSSLAHLS